MLCQPGRPFLLSREQSQSKIPARLTAPRGEEVGLKGLRHSSKMSSNAFELSERKKKKCVQPCVCVYAHASGLLCLCFSAVLQIRPEVPARFPPAGVRGAGKTRGLQKLRSHS